MSSAAEVTGLYLNRQSTLEQIDCALDKGDRRAFRVWSGRYQSLTMRLANLLVKLVATEV